MAKPKVAIVKCEVPEGNKGFMAGKYTRLDSDIVKIKAAVAKAIELSIGSLDAIIKEGDTVLIKPNLAFQAPPESFAVVDPRTVEAVTAYVKENSKAGKVYVGDNPSLGMHVGRARPAFEVSGMGEAARLGGADDVLLFDEMETVDVDIPGAKIFKHAKIFKPVIDADVIINLPKMKVHLANMVTLGVKNWNGIIPNVHPDGQQQGAHRIDLGQKMADILKFRMADLTIVDGIIGMEGQGPHAGTPIEMNVILAGQNTVAVDSVACRCMGIYPEESPAIRAAWNDGLGPKELEDIDVVGEKVADVMKVFRRPNDNPMSNYKGMDCYFQQTCPGCYVNVRGALDSFVICGVDFDKFIKAYGEIVVLAGGCPDFDPEVARGKNLMICGDCWKLFPSKPLVEKAAELAKSVTYYPGCAPVYIFSKINTDLQEAAKNLKL